MASAETFDRLAEAGFGGVAYQVILWAIAHREADNWVHLNTKSLAEHFDRNRSHMHGAVNSLVDGGFLHRGAKVGQSWAYIIDTGLTCQTPEETERIRALIEERKGALDVAS